jgi:archaeosine synthase beta-subunit
MTPAAYPERASERRAWITAHRGPRNQLDPFRPHAVFVERERSDSGEIVPVLTVLLTNRECPWRCLMCDLWKNTLTETVPVGAIPAQIDHALREGSVPSNDTPHQIKLYNSGSFFDHHAIPPQDYPAIAERVRSFRRVVVECHPRLVGQNVIRFRDLLGSELEVAMGLETANPDVLAQLNKGMTLDDFANAAVFLRHNGISVRAFFLLRPPFTSEIEGVEWAKRSIQFAFDCGANVVSIIPTRAGNGALEDLAASGEFESPRLSSLEHVLECGIALGRGRVFADLWDLQRFADCPACFEPRRQRLEAMNHSQKSLPPIACPACAA